MDENDPVDESDRTINKLTFTATLCSSANKEERGDNYPECNTTGTADLKLSDFQLDKKKKL